MKQKTRNLDEILRKIKAKKESETIKQYCTSCQTTTQHKYLGRQPIDSYGHFIHYYNCTKCQTTTTPKNISTL